MAFIKVNANDITLATNPGMEVSANGLKLKLSGSTLEIDGANGARIATGAAGNGLTGGGAAALSVQVQAEKGLSVGGSGLAVDVADGLVLTASGVAAQIESNKGLGLTNAGLKAIGGNGITVGASGIEAVVESNQGLGLTGSGLKAVAGNGISVGASGIVADIDGTSLALGAGGLSLNAANANTWTAIQTFSGVVARSTVDPSGANDLTRKSWVETQIDVAKNDFDVKQSVVVATTAVLPNSNYNNGSSGVGATLTGAANGAFAAVDGVTLSAGQRILVKNETGDDAPYNGIYSLTTVGDGSNPFVLTRTTDADSTSEVHAGNFMFVEAGSTNGGAQFVLTTTGAITVGTTNLSYDQYGASGPHVAAGNGLTDTSGTFAIQLDGNTGLAVGGGGLKIDLANTGSGLLALNGNNRLRVKSGDDGLPVKFEQMDITSGQFSHAAGVSTFTMTGKEVLSGANSLGFLRLFKSGVDVMKYDANLGNDGDWKITTGANSVLTIEGDVTSGGDTYRIYFATPA